MPDPPAAAFVAVQPIHPWAPGFSPAPTDPEELSRYIGIIRIANLNSATP